ncbi:MAG TPA: hypothetical protein VEH56_06390 [Candidatus Saccharimonadales bacterium]|nr:hypothetical protein [Candidatus Saccharimonadales bacterium]
MPYMAGILVVFQLILVFGAAIVAAVVWVLFKLGRLTDAYTQKQKAQIK